MSARTSILAAGLRWLYETEQPDGAMVFHLGTVLGDSDGSRTYGFVPDGIGRPVVVVKVARQEWKDEGSDRVLANPIGVDELIEVAAELSKLGAKVVHTWNGHPSPTGSLALDQLAHPSLLAAVEKYSAGCPVHPQRSVFCDCGWKQAYDLAVMPAREGGDAR